MSPTESQKRRQQVAHGLGIALLGWLVLAILSVAGAFESFDLRLLDWRFRLRGERPASDAIAIVGVDDATIRAYGSWPLPRDSYGLLVTALEEAGARAIAFDLQFPADANQDARWDRLLAQVTESHPNVVQAIWFQAAGSAPRPDPPDPEVVARLAQRGLPAAGVPAPIAATVGTPFADLLAATTRLGHLTVAIDPDGAIRRVPMLVQYEGRVYPSLSLSAFATYRGWQSATDVEWSAGSALVHWPEGAHSPLPLHSDGSTAIDFAGDHRSFRRTYSMLDVLQWYRSGEAQRLRDAVEGRVVIVGLTSQHEASEDIGTTPFAAATPLIYVHANAIDNLLSGRFLRRPPVWLHVVALAVVGSLLGWVFASLSIPVAALVMGIAVLGLALVNQILLAGPGIDVPPSAGLALAPLIYAGIASHRYVFLDRSSREREQGLREGRLLQQRFLPEALIGQVLSHYRIVEKIGQGGMGEVYRARDEHLPRDVAIKLLGGRGLADEAMRRRFRREALAFSKLNHRHIATIFEFDSQDGTDFIVMEYVRGTTLARALERGPLPEHEALRVGTQVAEALVEAHARGVQHRDLKPANIMLTPEGEAKVLDFGVAKLVDLDATTMSNGLTETGAMVGTLAYMAPEVLCGQPADARTDLYGLGMILFEAVTGRRPFPDDLPHELMYTIVNQAPPDPGVLNAKLSARARAVILKAIEKVPGDRYSSAQLMLDDLREAARDTATRPSGSAC